MANLLEITPSTRKVKTARLGEVDVPGLSLVGLVQLFRKHPELLNKFKEFQKDEVELGLQELIDLGLDFTLSFLAAGLGYPGDEKAIEQCKHLTPEDVWNVGEAILNESFPGGVSGFFEKVVGAMQKANVLEVKAPATSGQKASLIPSERAPNFSSPKDTATSSGTPQSNS